MGLDQQSLQILGTVHPEVKTRVLRVYQDVSVNLGLEMRPTRGLASLEDQRKLWMIGRDADGNVVDPAAVVTQAPPGSSWHNFGLAVDSCFRGADPYWKALPKEDAEKRWLEFGRFCELHGLVWGGRFQHFDGPHAQMSFGMTLRDAQDLWKFGGLSAIFSKVDQTIKGNL